MAQTAFTQAFDKLLTTLAADHAAGDGRLVLAPGSGAAFGTVTPASPVRVMVITQASYGTAAESYSIYKATGIVGDTLTGISATEGTSDLSYAAASWVEVRDTAGYINDLNAAVNALEAAPPSGSTPNAGSVSTDHAPSRFANVLLAPYSAPAGGVTDAASAIQAAADSLLDPPWNSTTGVGSGQGNSSTGTAWFPECNFAAGIPIWLDADGISLKGAGAAVSKISGLPGIHPILIGPKRRAGWNRALVDGFNVGGTCTFTSGSTAVVGTGTTFTKRARAGMRIYLNSDGSGKSATIAAVVDDTHLTLSAPYSGTGGTGGTTANTSYLATIPVIFAADHRVDALGVLDNSCALGDSVMRAGMRWGVTTRSPSSGSPWPDHFLTWWATPPATGGGTVWGSGGDRWATTNKLTISFYIAPPNALGLPGAAIMGMGGIGGPSPWYLGRQGNQFLFQFRTSADAAGATPRAILFGDTRIAGPTQVTVEVDMTATDWQSGPDCSIRAWVGRKEIAITRGPTGNYGIGGTGGGPSFKPTDNLKFGANYYAPFNIGAATPTQVQWTNPEFFGDRGDFTIYGLAISSDALYESDTAAVGGNQRFKAAGPFAGKAMNDFNQFCGVDKASTLVCNLYTAQRPTADYPGKLAWMETGPAGQNVRVMGLFTYSASDVIAGAVGLNEVSGLSITGWGGMNAGISVGPCLYPTFRDLVCISGWWAIGSFITSAGVYDIEVDNCRLAGLDAGYFGANQIVFIKNMKRVDCGHTAVRLVGSEAHVEGLLIGSWAAPVEAYVAIHGQGAYSSEYRFKDISVDHEGGPSPSLAPFYCERSNSGNTILDIDNFAWGTVDPTRPVVWLADPFSGGAGVGTFRFSRPEGSDGLIVKADSLNWEGDIQEFPSVTGSSFRPIASGDVSGLSNVRVVLYRDALPTAGTFLKDSVDVVIRHPASGQPKRYRCTASGTYGSGPPTWGVAETQP